LPKLEAARGSQPTTPKALPAFASLRDHQKICQLGLASPESYDLLVHRRGYSIDRFRVWMQRTLSSAVLSRQFDEQ
jgi:hypothetical protein